MPFVKLDCGILDSTLWIDRDAREIFLTALLMARPIEYETPVPEYEIVSTDLTGWEAPPGRYGLVEAAGVAICRRACIPDDAGIGALIRLSKPEPDSRTPDFEGRRLIRIDGGFLVLNFARYRDKDYTAADRQRRYRERQKAESNAVTSLGDAVTSRQVTQAEAEVYKNLPKKEGSRAKGARIPSKHIDLIFQHWKTVFEHPNAKASEKRRRLISARLKDYSLSELRSAIDGYKLSAWHNGKNPSGQQYTSIELILRDAEHVERGIEFSRNPPKDGGKQSSYDRSKQKLDDWARDRGIDPADI